MNYDEPRLHRPVRAFTLLAFAAFIFGACQGDLPNVPTEQTFTKEKLEKIGTMLRNELLDQHEFLPELPPYDTSVYWYVQTLYGQATSTMHLDRQSPVYNKWDQDRQWEVFILKNDTERLAFTLPGGDFFISTGMLKSFQKDFELYALLSFEATLMDDGYLLAQWVKEYNSLTINNLIEGNDQPNPLTAEVLAQEMTSFVFAPETIEAVDKAAIDNTCATSILDPVGLLPFISNSDFISARWLQTRPSYEDRDKLLPDMANMRCQNDQQGNGNYKRFVLEVLD
ncbi:MAG: hypothetical protein K9J37_03520 [Saprospiraceae bacterium]|nr:hypothetical protein [Saprospiraceae bacterium]MCF8248952.1 hypothetical protein [Saprospiraceae bacterium]MCF8279163.1 hypothetical protein [Bacteroidales bacterium]MCF8310846.1 hypothetical protein [Saprospiraceae bacterium]MCF8439566.1 hypothetical protein [Saprospiraceae bacterium]